MARGGPSPISWVIGLLALALLAPLGWANAPVHDGLVVAIPPAISDASTNRLKSQLHGPLERFKATRTRGSTFTLVCDFNSAPGHAANESENFGACVELARYLRSLPKDITGVRTVAFISREVRQYSALPALACADLILSDDPKAGIGQVTTPGRPLARHERAAYEDPELVNRHSLVLVRKMYDPDLEVYLEHQPDGAKVFHDGATRPLPPAWKQVFELARGTTAFYSAEKARDYGLAKPAVCATLEDVLALYGVPRTGPRPALDQVIAWRIPVVGELTRDRRDRVKRHIEKALRARANVLILELKCAGGDVAHATELGNYLATLNDKRKDAPVQTIAYVTNGAKDLAAFVAFGCNKIVMQRELREGTRVTQEGAHLGNFEAFILGHPSLDGAQEKLDALKAKPNLGRQHDLEKLLGSGVANVEKPLRDALGALLPQQRYPRVLADAFFTKDTRLRYAESAKNWAERRVLLEAEYLADQKKEKKDRLWREGAKSLGPPAGTKEYLTVTAEQAVEFNLAAYAVKDFNALCEVEGYSAEEVKAPEADWLEAIADFLRDPWTSVLLVMVGITCLILELKMPGVGLPGVIAAICFVLFFWAHSQLNGQITWLALLLFVLGLGLLGFEIFVLPGFGVCGISGILLVLTSLGLVAYGHWPRSAEWVGFGEKLGPFGISLLGSLVCVFLVVRYLPHIPVLNRLMHQPTEDELYETAPTVNPAYAELLGAIGVAATPLRPAGKTQFGSNFVDVVAEGGYIAPGRRVQVVEVEGNRVVVKEV